ncbi:unnamed protein product [Mytilus coruscus]|uniref:Uncharacterized protein n=1 Tax=Mytilus coruscus TaxID=42192 RepID=A0A6J8CX46_MYTCO|nr:unnamed protein product [Mytilus coruscus]
MKPVIGNSPQWKKEGENIRQLADCMSAYREYLLLQNQVTQKNQSLDHPVRTIDKFATIEHRRMTSTDVKSCYKLLDEDVRSKPKSVPILFDEDKHLDRPFEDYLKRLRYFEKLQLSTPVDIIRFCPGGSILTTVCIVKVNANRSESEILIDGARMLQKSKVHLQEFHTRAQRSLFKQKLQNVTKVLPSEADLIYKELTLDAATVNHPVTQERLRLIFLCEQGLLADLRNLNAGRPTGTYDVFFDKLSGVVEEVTAADDRRHNVSHLSQWISLDELIKISSKKCPEGTQIPSKSLVRLQFAPKNPYTRAALNFTEKIQVQYKIQRRQLRSAHPDDHYCAAQLKYFKKMASELRELAAVFFCDDKAKIPVGSPGCPISTGVRGKKSIAPTCSTFGAKDHDMSMSSITPSVILQCEVPVDASKSFVRGTVTNIVNDSVLETSNPFRHAAALIKVFNNSP